MKVIVAGDFAPRARLAKQIEEKKYSEVFPEDLRTVIKSADFSFVNFESPIAEVGFLPIPKCGPNLKCTSEAAEAIKFAGFTGVTMANNHILDFGKEGLRKSVECCKNLGLDVVGVGENLKDAEKILYLKKEGKRLAVINCCEHEFSIATDIEAGANPLNPVRQFYAIQQAKKNADFVMVIVHGGHEHYQLPSPRMVETYRFFIDSGADAVLNHHQHCFSGYEVYNGKPIFYGLGNFCFDISPTKSESSWNYGYLVEIDFEECIGYRIIPYSQCGEMPRVDLVDENKLASIISNLNDIISNEEKLKTDINKYYQSTVQGVLSMYQPYENRLMKKLYRLGIIPSCVSNKKITMLYNYLSCESHREKQMCILKNIFRK